VLCPAFLAFLKEIEGSASIAGGEIDSAIVLDYGSLYRYFEPPRLAERL